MINLYKMIDVTVRAPRQARSPLFPSKDKVARVTDIAFPSYAKRRPGRR